MNRNLPVATEKYNRLKWTSVWQEVWQKKRVNHWLRIEFQSSFITENRKNLLGLEPNYNNYVKESFNLLVLFWLLWFNLFWVVKNFDCQLFLMQPNNIYSKC